MKDVIGFGALNVDLIFEIESFAQLAELGEEISAGAEVFQSSEQFEATYSLVSRVGRLVSKSGGGQAANTAVALSQMGFSTGYVGKLGRDEEGEFILQSLGSVETSRIRQNKKSGLCISLLDRLKNRAILVFPHSNDTLTYQEIDLDYLKETKFLHLTSFAGDKPFNAQKKLVGQIPAEVKISFDPGELYARRGLKELVPLIENSFIIFITERELSYLFDIDFRQAAKRLLDYGPSIVVCKRGEKGSHIFTLDEEIYLKAKKTEVLDTTGAGDVYAAGFLAGLLLEHSLRTCAILATEAAALSVTGYGRERYPDKEFLRHILANYL